jgi:hypothetical protein
MKTNTEIEHKNFHKDSGTFIFFYILVYKIIKNKSSRRVTYGNPCYSIGSKANLIYFLNDRSVVDNHKFVLNLENENIFFL